MSAPAAARRPPAVVLLAPERDQDSKCGGCGLPLQRCYLQERAGEAGQVKQLCSVCRGHHDREAQEARA